MLKGYEDNWKYKRRLTKDIPNILIIREKYNSTMLYNGDGTGLPYLVADFRRDASSGTILYL